MAVLHCKGNGTCVVASRTSVLVVPRSLNGRHGKRQICNQHQALAGHLSVAANTESISHPAIPRLRNIFFGRENATAEPQEQAASTSAIQQELDADLLTPWSQRFLRQVPALPNGQKAMHYLLWASEDIRAKAAEGTSGHRGVIEAYLQLALIDVTAQCWQERLQELEALQMRVDQGSQQMQEISHQLLEARMALSGCRYLRLEAVGALARQVHMLVDDCGHSPILAISSLPQPHTTGINFPQLLQQGLGLDLQNPSFKTLSEIEVQNLQDLSWSEYHAKATDPNIVGEWRFCYWFGNASLVPAPYGKFSTTQVAGLLTSDVVLFSLPNGVWGRSLVAAAIEVGVVLESWAEPSRVMAGAGHVGSASAWMFFESQMGVQGNMHKVRQLALAVAAAAVTMVQQHQQQQ